MKDGWLKGVVELGGSTGYVEVAHAKNQWQHEPTIIVYTTPKLNQNP